MNINRVWAMPNKNTFDIKPIKELVSRYIHPNSIDPFANKNRLATVTNDIDPSFGCDHNLDAIEFLKAFPNESIQVVLYDPPYSPRQVSESYKKMGGSVNMQTTQASYWSNQKGEIKRITKVGGYVITCGWNSGGIGKTNGFEIIEILMVPHGGWHNDTIVTVERKIASSLTLFS